LLQYVIEYKFTALFDGSLFLLQRNLFYTEINVITTRVLVQDYHFMRKHRLYIIVSFKLYRPTIILERSTTVL